MLVKFGRSELEGILLDRGGSARISRNSFVAAKCRCCGRAANIYDHGPKVLRAAVVSYLAESLAHSCSGSIALAHVAASSFGLLVNASRVRGQSRRGKGKGGCGNSQRLDFH